MKTLDDVARDVVTLLESLNIPYAMMGGLAVRLHALPRPTFDVDFTIAIPRDQLADLYNCFEKMGYVVPESQKRGWVDTVRTLPVIKMQLLLGGQSIDVDMFLAETAYQKVLLERRQRYDAEGWSAWFVTPEDLILLKLIAGRPKDRADVADILFVQGKMDLAYMRQWAQGLGIAAELEKSLEQTQ